MYREVVWGTGSCSMWVCTDPTSAPCCSLQLEVAELLLVPVLGKPKHRLEGAGRSSVSTGRLLV